MKNRNKQSEDKMRRAWAKSFVLKTVSLLIPFGIYVSVQLNVAAANIQNAEENSQKFVYENWGTVALVSSVILSLLLIAYFNSAYSIFWAKATEAKLDERQLAVRNRAFLRSYRWFILIFFLTYFNTSSQLSDQRVEIYTVYGLILLAIALPSMLASWNKNA